MSSSAARGSLRHHRENRALQRSFERRGVSDRDADAAAEATRGDENHPSNSFAALEVRVIMPRSTARLTGDRLADRRRAPESHAVVDRANARGIARDPLDRVAVTVRGNGTRQVNHAGVGIDGDCQRTRLRVRGKSRAYVIGDRSVIALDDGLSGRAAHYADQDRDRHDRSDSRSSVAAG